MNRTVWKLRPTKYWRIGEHESWFTDMAGEGLYLKKMGLRFAQFMKGEPKKIRYRIDISSKNKMVSEQKQRHYKNGWDYVTSYGEFNVYSSSDSFDGPELLPDPVEQSHTLKELERRLVVSSIFVVVATILMLGMLSAVWFFNPAPFLALVEGSIIQQGILAILTVYMAYTSLRAAIYIRVLRRNLAEGIPIKHDTPWKKQHRVTSVITSIFIVFIIFGSILPLMQLYLSRTVPLPLDTTELPIVRLGEIEQFTNLVRVVSNTNNNIDRGNRYIYDWSFLAPVQYQSNEYGTVPKVMWKDGSGQYSPSISSRVYKLRIGSMAESVIYDLIKRYGMVYRGGDFITVEHADFDLLIIHGGEGYQEVFASKGKAVMHIQYFGYADINSIIKSITHRIELISD